MTDKGRALAALRDWRATMLLRDPLIAQASRAGATIAEIMDASACAKNTVRAALATSPQEHTPMPTQTADPLADLHHPHFISRTADPQWPSRTVFTFRPFTGREPGPEYPSWEITEKLPLEQRGELMDEYRAAEIMWELARFKVAARTALADAVPVWQTYATAHDEMSATFAAFRDLPDDRWRSQILALTEAHERTLAAAHAWDLTAGSLSSLIDEHINRAGEREALSFEDIATGAGIDIAGWVLGSTWDYNRIGWRTPLVAQVSDEIEAQKERLKRISELAPE